MNFKIFKEIMSKYHGISRNVDFGEYFNVSPQTISNWKQRNKIPGYIASKLNNQPYVQFNHNIGSDQTLKKFIDLFLLTSDAIIESECDKVLGQEFGLASAQGLFKTDTLRGWFIKTTGDWEKISGYNNSELIRMSNIFQELYDLDYPKSIRLRFDLLEKLGTDILISTRPWMINRKDGSIAVIQAKVKSDYRDETFKMVIQDYQILNSKSDIEQDMKDKLWFEGKLTKQPIIE